MTGLTIWRFAWCACRKGYLEIDEDDPFLPRPDNASPSYYRYGSLPSRPTSVHEEASWVVPSSNSSSFGGCIGVEHFCIACVWTTMVCPRHCGHSMEPWKIETVSLVTMCYRFWQHMIWTLSHVLLFDDVCKKFAPSLILLLSVWHAFVRKVH